jgi:hypothetical protein
MTRRIRGVSILAGLAVLGAVLTCGREAQAGTAKGIVVTSGGTMQIGDPLYEYVFTAELLAGSTLQNGGYFTIYDLPDLISGALTSQPNISWGSSVQFLGITPSGVVVTDDPNIFNVTWQWNGSSPIVAPDTSNLDLGTFTVGATTELSSPPRATVIYVGTLDGGLPVTQGTLYINPEPSSVLLLLTGAGVLPLLLRQRRRRASGSVAA